jgi:hypothetical protein
MRLLRSNLAFLSFPLLLGAVTASEVDYSQYVNALMGSEGPTPGQGFGGGDIFVGGARPFGVAKVGLDTTAANWSIAVLNGGWTPDGNVTGISRFTASVRVVLFFLTGMIFSFFC